MRNKFHYFIGEVCDSLSSSGKFFRRRFQSNTLRSFDKRSKVDEGNSPSLLRNDIALPKFSANHLSIAYQSLINNRTNTPLRRGGRIGLEGHEQEPLPIICILHLSISSLTPKVFNWLVWNQQ